MFKMNKKKYETLSLLMRLPGILSVDIYIYMYI